jgi:hypothetical protein
MTNLTNMKGLRKMIVVALTDYPFELIPASNDMTGIGALQPANECQSKDAQQQILYDLSGRSTSLPLLRGVYLKNGKKYWRK